MSYYDNQQWTASGQQNWEQQTPPARSGASSAVPREDSTAFMTQLEEVDRAIDNLVKSGKMFNLPGRRDSMPLAGGQPRAFAEQAFDPRMGGGPPRHHSVSGDFGGGDARSFSGSNLQSFYASQRHQPSRGTNEAEQVMQAKRRMAAQRERELRNYHQEQQYNRSLLAEMSSNKSDRSMSPSTMSEEGRRELIARQHRALYGNESAGFVPQGMYGDENNTRDQGGSVPPTSAGGQRGNSPRGMDPFQGENGAQGGPGTQESNRGEKPGSPSFDGPTQQSTKGPTPPAGEEGHSRQVSKSITAPVGGPMGPIGSRPLTQQVPNQGLNKRTTSPLPASLNYGFGNNEQTNERAASSNSNTNNQKDPNAGSGMGAWGTGSGVWGSNKIGTTVWG